MDKDIKEKWLVALRSGEYEQGNCALRTNANKYCCLGVLCDISGAGEWGPENKSLYYYVMPSGDHSCAYLPNELLGRFGFDGEEHELTRLNDGHNDTIGLPVAPVSFAVIADWIEENM